MGRPALRVFDENGLKVCGKCGAAKPASAYHRDRKTATGYNVFCKECAYQKKGRPRQVIRDGKKQCSRCKEWKLLDEFSDHSRTTSGKDSRCKLCRLHATQQRQSSSPEKFLKKLSHSHTQNLKVARGRRAEWVQGSTVTYEVLLKMWQEQDGRCAITGMPLTYNLGGDRYSKDKWTNASIDRIDPARGYVKGNIQLVCWAVNTMKWVMTLDELKAWCHAILWGAENLTDGNIARTHQR